MKIDHVHFYTRNAARTKDWFISNVGFKAIGNCLNQHTHTELIVLNSVYFLISSPLNSTSPVEQYLAHHPEGVGDIAFRVTNLTKLIDRSRDLGLKILQDIQQGRSHQGKFKFAQIMGWQDLRHTLIEASGHHDYCSPISFKPEPCKENYPYGITDIDHIVLNVSQGKLNSAVKLYQELFQFEVQQSFQIQTSKSGLTSQALIDGEGGVQFNINQPTTTNSQIQEFINFNRGSGIQHLALRSPNLIADIAQMRRGSLKFLDIPQTYYQNLKLLLSLDPDDRQAVAQQQILVDSDRNTPESLLMQIFTQPIFTQPTFFLEFIERRRAAKGFGQGNFQALFAAVERQSEHRPSIHQGNKKTVGD